MLGLAVLLVASAFAGCGGPGTTPAPTAPSTSAVVATPAPEPTPSTAAEVIAGMQAEAKRVEDKRSECVEPEAPDTCAVEHVQLAMDVGRDSIQKLSQFEGPNVEKAINAASKLAAPKDGVACVETSRIMSCFFASPDAYRAARALQRELAGMKENL